MRGWQLTLEGLEPSCAPVPAPVPTSAPTPASGLAPDRFASQRSVLPPPPLHSPSVPSIGEVPPAASAALWVHPQANRQAVLKGQGVAYLFRRGQRKTIGFSVSAQGLSVSAPRWATLGAVDTALQSKADWVLRKLAQVAQQQRALQGARMEWRDGASLDWLGASLELRLVAGGAPARPASRHATLVQREGGRLWVTLPVSATAAQWRDAVQAWMMQSAQSHFVERLNHFAPLLGVQWRGLRLSSAATRWGSAKADGSIRLHWRLMQFDPAIVDYVVAHELSHLRHMDHSPRFWQTVASVVPDYAALRARLRGERLPPW